MKISAATTKGGLEDRVASTFGRAPTFTIVDVDEDKAMTVSILPNDFASATGGAGIQAAQQIINSGAQAIIAGKFGPNASEVFSRSEIKMLEFEGSTVREAVQRCMDDELTDSVPNNSSSEEYSSGIEAGRGFGRGRGMGQGKGIGRGRGMGQGRGSGRRMGRGRATGQGRQGDMDRGR